MDSEQTSLILKEDSLPPSLSPLFGSSVAKNKNIKLKNKPIHLQLKNG